jgi:hypothetical protein
MRRWQKIALAFWTTALAAPILWLAFALATAGCEDVDPCPTGGPGPHSGTASAILVAVALLQLAFLVMLWRIPGRPGCERE